MSDDLRRLEGGVIDLSQFREKKEAKKIEPLFTEPTLITLGDPEKPEEQVEYLLLVNLVISDKQFLALESMEKEERGTVAVVEAIVEDNVFAGVQAIASEEEYEEVVGIMTKALNSNMEEDSTNDN
jgi:hypothetical protein